MSRLSSKQRHSRRRNGVRSERVRYINLRFTEGTTLEVLIDGEWRVVGEVVDLTYDFKDEGAVQFDMRIGGE